MTEPNEVEERKQKLKEKRELKMLERFMYEDKQNSLRSSTRNTTKQDNFYTDLLKRKSDNQRFK